MSLDTANYVYYLMEGDTLDYIRHILFLIRLPRNTAHEVVEVVEVLEEEEEEEEEPHHLDTTSSLDTSHLSPVSLHGSPTLYYSLIPSITNNSASSSVIAILKGLTVV